MDCDNKNRIPDTALKKIKNLIKKLGDKINEKIHVRTQKELPR